LKKFFLQIVPSIVETCSLNQAWSGARPRFRAGSDSS